MRTSPVALGGRCPSRSPPTQGASKISRIENGKQGINTEDVASLLAIYGVKGEERGALIAKTVVAEKPDYWEIQGPLSKESRTLSQLEPQATVILDVEPLLIPGLLQTPEYTRAVMKACGLRDEDAEIRIAARLARQVILSRAEPPELIAIIDEGALRRPVLEPRLMARQLRRLLEAAERSTVTLLVLPTSLGAHTGLDGAFTILDFEREKSVVYLDHKVSGLFLEQPEHVAYYRRQVDTLGEVALGIDASADRVAAIARELEQE
ncbi:DUF5753 domain-containing protein [Nocardiopsis flavescens]